MGLVHRLRFLLPALAALAAFAGPARADETDAAALKERAKQFWDARVKEDFGAVWDMLPPQEQAQVEREAFAKYQKEGGPFLYTAAEVLDVTAQKEVAWVLVRYSVSPRQFKIPPREVKAWDIWEKFEDGWRPCARARLDHWPRKPPQERPAEEEALLAKRIVGFWDARKAQDWRAAWEFLEPAYRATTTVEEFLSRKSQLDYLGHELAWVEVSDATTGRAKITFEYKYNDPSLSKMEPRKAMDVEQWIKVDGQWFRHLVKPEGAENPLTADPSIPGAAPGKPGDQGRN